MLQSFFKRKSGTKRFSLSFPFIFKFLFYPIDKADKTTQREASLKRNGQRVGWHGATLAG
jgi:hypothetical protein